MTKPRYRWPAKRPREQLLYGLDWRKWQVAHQAEVLSVEWDVPAGLVEVGRAFVDGIALIMLRGGEAGAEYTLACRPVLSTNVLPENEEPERLVGLSVAEF